MAPASSPAASASAGSSGSAVPPQAHKNLGDAAWLLALHDPEAEEEKIGKGIEGGDRAEAAAHGGSDEQPAAPSPVPGLAGLMPSNWQSAVPK